MGAQESRATALELDSRAALWQRMSLIRWQSAMPRKTIESGRRENGILSRSRSPLFSRFSRTPPGESRAQLWSDARIFTSWPPPRPLFTNFSDGGSKRDRRRKTAADSSPYHQVITPREGMDLSDWPRPHDARQKGQSRGRLFRTGGCGVPGFGADEVVSALPKSTRCGTFRMNVFSAA